MVSSIDKFASDVQKLSASFAENHLALITKQCKKSLHIKRIVCKIRSNVFIEFHASYFASYAHPFILFTCLFSLV